MVTGISAASTGGVLVKAKGKGSLICIAIYYEPLVSKVRLETRLSTRVVESSIYRAVPIQLLLLEYSIEYIIEYSSTR